jgi:hypothetical protein
MMIRNLGDRQQAEMILWHVAIVNSCE